MPRIPSRAVAFVAAAGIASGLAACGGSTGDDSSGGGGSNSISAANKISGPAGVKAGTYYDGVPVKNEQKKGGTLKAFSAEGFQQLDPGRAYFQGDYIITSIVHRQLYTYDPSNSSKIIPDIASAQPVVSPDGKTVTVKLRPNVMIGDPVDRAVTSDDIKYGIERGLRPAILNGYIKSYFGDLVGYDKAVAEKGAGKISGIETPDKTTVVFKLDKPSGATLAKALVLPLTSPVSRSYASSKDAKNPDPFDQDPTLQAPTGPYEIKEYSAGKSMQLVRNPKWNGPQSGDPRPAYLDGINIAIGGDSSVIAKQIQNTPNAISLDPAPSDAVKNYSKGTPKQITFSALGNRYVALNTTKAPFDDVNVRKAAAAILDRTSMRKQRGGPLVGEIATHFLFPDSPGFDESGGENGTGEDFLSHPSGDLATAQKYLKLAGFKDGRYKGPKMTFIGDTESPGRETTQVMKNSLAKIGMNVDVRSVQHVTMYQKYCQVVKAMKDVDGCPNFGWLPDFVDAGPMLSPTFSGDTIQPTNMNNPSLFDDKAINAQIAKGLRTADETQRDAILGAADKAITDKVPAIPWLWDTQANIQGKGTHGVIANWNSVWDLAYTSVNAGS